MLANKAYVFDRELILFYSSNYKSYALSMNINDKNWVLLYKFNFYF